MSSILRKLKLKQDIEESTEDKATLMMRNGATVLKELIASSNGKYNPYRIFSTKELKLATNNFDKQNVIIQGGFNNTLFKGFWQERLLSVMKFDTLDWSIRNIVYASQMGHKHILKLIGCCLETEIPILVFEYVNCGTLADRIRIDSRSKPQIEPLLLTHRLKIAMEIANAMAYLHLRFPRPIIFRDFKASHILFNEENVAKLFDFSLSISIPKGETHITDEVRGTMGFISPEYLSTGAFNEKLDVFSFGIFLGELLSGQRAVNFALLEEEEEGVLLLDSIKKCFTENRLNEIIDPLIVEDNSCLGKEEQLQAFVQLIFKCANASPEDRPTMVDVAKKLRQMYRSYS